MTEIDHFSIAELQARGCLLVEDGNHGEYRPRPDEFGTGTWSFIRAADMSDGRVLFDQAQKINDRARQRIRKGVGAPGDVLVSHKGTVGKIAAVPHDAPPFVCSPQTTFWRSLDSDVLDARYLYSYLCSSDFQQQLDMRKGETDMAPYVSLTAQRQLRVPLPPIDVQRAIGGLIGALDDKIALNRRMNRTLEATAAALFRSWFMDFDPVAAKAEGRRAMGVSDAVHAAMPDTFAAWEGEPVPNGWAIAPIRQLLSIAKDQIDPAASPTATFDHYSIPAFDDGLLPAPDAGVSIKSTKYRVPGEAILLSKLNPHTPRVWWPAPAITDRSICSTEFMPCVPAAGVPREFIYSLLNAAPFTESMASLVTGTSNSHQRVKPGDFLGLHVIAPPITTMRDYADSTREMLARARANLLENRTLAALRDALLPQLLSGALRLRDTKRTVAAAV